MLSLYRTLSLRYWRLRWTRAGLVLVSIALGVAAWIATGVLNRSLEKASRSAATPLAGDADLYVTNGDAGVRGALAEPLAAIAGVRAVHPLVIQRVILPDLGHRSALLLGLDWAGQRTDDSSWSVSVRELTTRACIRSVLLRQRPVLLGRQLDQDLPADEEQVSVLVAGQVQRLRRTGTIDGHGPAAALAGNTIVLECDAAAALLGRPDLVSRLDLCLEPGADTDEVRQRVEGLLAGRAQVWTPEAHGQRVQEMLSGLTVGFALCGAGALVVGLFLVYNALAVGVAERRHDVGILRSVGATRGQVVALFLGEAALMGLAGTILGMPLGLGLARLSLGPMQQILCDVFLPVQLQQLQVTAGTVAGTVAAGLATAVLAGLLPSAQAACDGPADALRRVPPTCGPAYRLLQVAISVGLVGLGLTLLLFRHRLPARFGSYGSLVVIVLAALLAIPVLAALGARLLRPAARAILGIPGRLALDNLIRAPGRTGVVITALAAGVALLVQTGGLIRSNEDAVRAWVDRCIAGDLFVASGGPASATGQTLPMAEAVGRRLEQAFPEIRVVPMRFRYLDWHQAGRHARVLLLAMDIDRYVAANENRRLADLDFYRELRRPGTALVSENFAALHQVRAGDPLTLPGADGPVTLRVIGTIADYSCNRGTVIVDRAHYRRQFGADLVDVFDVYLPPAADAGAVRQRVQASPLAAEQALVVLTRGEVRDHILGMVGRLYGLAYTQEVLVGIVAVLGMVAALLVSVLQRRRELGLLRAVGATRAQVFRSVLAEALFMAGMGTAIGLVLGVPLEWYTLRVLLFEDSGFLCPVHFPWAAAAAVTGLALAGALVAGLGPALHAVRPAIVEAVAHE